MAPSFFASLEELIRATALDPATASVSEILADIGSPSTSIAVLDNDEISSHCISTLSHDTDTLFQACSISKPLGGLMITKLVELGHFSFDDKMVDLLPADIFELMAKDTRREALLRTVTVKQLMSHTSGMSIHGFPGYADHDNLPSLYQIFEGRSAASSQPITMQTLPGLEFMYSGGGMTVLQCIAETVMKKPFAELMKEFIFGPLKMDRSFYQLNANEQNLASSYWQGYHPAAGKWHVLPELMAAGLWTTPTDLLKVVRAVQDSLDGAKPDTILKKENARMMLTRVKEFFGLSWMVDDATFGHGGNNYPGYECTLLGFADLSWNKQQVEDQPKHSVSIPHGCGISIMTNSARGSLVYLRLLSSIAYLKGWSIPSDKLLGDTYTLMPLPAAQQWPVDDTWEAWTGESWAKDWIIAKGKDGGPVAGIDKTVLVKLLPAAIPSKIYPNGKSSVDFVMDSISIMLRLGWEKDDRIIEVCNWGRMDVTVIHKKDGGK